jgi:hypothetical protein
MPDWKAIVRKHLRILSVCSPDLAETTAEELASHLEDRYEDLLRAGRSEDLAFERTLDELNHNGRNRLALPLLMEDTMTEFARRIGLPGLLTFASAMIIAWALDMVHVQPKTIFLSNGLFLSLPVAWMCALPLCGALGAMLSRRNGGSRLQCTIAATFPAIILGVVLLLVSVVGFVISLVVPYYDWSWTFVIWGLGLWGFGYSLLPAIALLLGSAAADYTKTKHPTVA